MGRKKTVKELLPTLIFEKNRGDSYRDLSRRHGVPISTIYRAIFMYNQKYGENYFVHEEPKKVKLDGHDLYPLD